MQRPGQRLVVEQQLLVVPANTALGQPAQGLRVQPVFLAQHPRRQGGRVIIGQHRYPHLRDDRPTVQFFGYEVYAGAVFLGACGKRALVCAQAPQRRQQGRMDVVFVGADRIAAPQEKTHAYK